MRTVTPGVQEATPVTAAQLVPMLVVAGVQSVPLQQRLGFGADWGWQVRPGAHAPVASHRHPFEPAMQVVATVVEVPVPPSGEVAGLLPHTLGVPPQPQHAGAVQVPQEIRLPQPSSTGPQFLPSDAHVAGTHVPPAPPVPIAT